MTRSALPVIANIPAVELERMDWYRQLGVSHRQRDEAAAHDALLLQERDREERTALRRRWPGIVVALRTLTGCYNEGAGLEALTVVEDANDGSRDLIVQVVARGGQTLTMVLAGTDLCVRASPGPAGAADDGRRWIAFEPSDEATAARALQPWLTQL